MPKIGSVKIENNIMLAPMHGVNCNAFRLLCKDYGSALSTTPMIHPDSLFHQKDRLDIIKEEKPVSVQIVGKDPEKMSKAASVIEEHADLIDINLGCPDKDILSQYAGSFLIKHPEQFVKMVSKVVSSVNIPVTAKIRIGWDKSCINAVEVSRSLEDLGVAAITVHGRTRKQAYSGKADWDMIKQVKDSIDIPVIGNGDVWQASDYKNMLEKAGVDFVMIGRAAIGNPLLFRNCINIMGGKELIRKDENIASELFNKFYDYYVKYSPRDSFSEVRQHAMWFFKGTKNSAVIKNRISMSKDVDEIKKIIKF